MKTLDLHLNDELFEYIVDPPDCLHFTWCITALRKAVDAGTVKCKDGMTMSVGKDWFDQATGGNLLEIEHLLSLKNQDLTRPVYVCHFPAGMVVPDEDGCENGFDVVIDGNHRAALAYLKGVKKTPMTLFELKDLEPFLVEDFPVVMSSFRDKILSWPKKTP